MWNSYRRDAKSLVTILNREALSAFLQISPRIFTQSLLPLSNSRHRKKLTFLRFHKGCTQTFFEKRKESVQNQNILQSVRILSIFSNFPLFTFGENPLWNLKNVNFLFCLELDRGKRDGVKLRGLICSSPEVWWHEYLDTIFWHHLETIKAEIQSVGYS